MTQHSIRTPLTELKFSSSAGAMEFEGYGAIFGNVDSYGDVIAPGAFKRTLREARQSGNWPSMLLQHGGSFGSAEDLTPIGVWTDFIEDAKGLRISGRLADTARGREVYTLMKMEPRPAIDGLSIGYVAKKFELGTKPGEPRRKLIDVDLHEVSLVTFPANDRARVTSVKDWRVGDPLTPRIVEQMLTTQGVPRAAARAIASRGAPAIAPGATHDEELADLAADLERAAAQLLKRGT